MVPDAVEMLPDKAFVFFDCCCGHWWSLL
jgi:hypothetical protein